MNKILKFYVIKSLEKSPEQSQRALSKSNSINLGSIHHCLNALIEKRFVKVENFKNAQNKLAYAYILTPAGIYHNKELAFAFFKQKQAEYVSLQKDIKVFKEDLAL